MVKLDFYSAKGIKKGNINLPKHLTEKENLPLLAQVIRVYEDKKHPGLSKVKTRGEVVASKRKIYRQKGTGGARHGSRNAPIFVGGGVAHGPKGVKRTLAIPKKIARKALGVAFGLKAKEGKVVVLDQVNSLKKTKDVATLINKIVKSNEIVGKNPHLTLALAEKNKAVARSARNIANLEVTAFRNLNASGVYFGGVFLVDKDAFSEKLDSQGKVEKSVAKKSTKAKEKSSKKETQKGK